MKNFTSKFLPRQVVVLGLIFGLFMPIENLNAQTYCTPQSYYGAYYGYMQYQSFSCSGGMQNINFAPGGYPNPIAGSPSYPTTSNQPGEGYYPPTAFTTQEVCVPGTTINYSFLTSSTYAGWLNIWVDFNQNGSFTDAGEWVFNPNATYPSGTTVNGSFTVPLTATLGLTRIRVSWMYSAYANPGPCYTYASNTMYYGVWTDFNFIVTGPCTGVPSALSIASPPMSGICSGSTAIISANETNFTTGQVTKWQSSLSPTGPWTIVQGGVGGGQNVNTTTMTTPPLVDTTYFRVYDSCTNSFQTSTPSSVYMVPVIKYSIPYLETFDNTANNSVPSCYLFNDNNGTNFTVQSGLHAPNGYSMTAMVANDPATNAAYGKNDFFTIPGLKLTANTLYAIRFKYARGKSNPYTNTGNSYNEHLQLFVNNYNPQYVVNNVTTGNKLFDQTINVDNVSDTTLYFTPLNTGGYYFSWYSNTPHPGGSTNNNPGGVVIVDSVYVGYGTCVAPAITSNPATSQNGCAGLPTTMSIAATGTGNNYQWYKNGNPIVGAVGSTFNIASTQSSDAGTYYCIASNPCGTATSTSDVLTVYSLPTASVTPSSTVTICSASGYTLSVNTSASSPTVAWYKNGTYVGSGSSFFPTSTGLYTATVTDANNCTASSSNTDTINVNASPSATVTPSGSTSFCVGDSVTLFAPVGGGITGYIWYNGANPIGGATSSTYKATTTGNYKVLVSNANCQLMSSVTAVTVSTPPPANISSIGSTTICQGSNVVLTANSGPYTYTWRLNGTPTAINSQNDTVTQAGNYSVIVAVGTCATTSSDISISLNSSPTPVLTPAGTVNLCTGASVNLTASGAGVGGSYQWYYNGVANGNSLNTQMANTGGQYTVLVTNSLGCSAMSTPANLNVIPLPNATFTPSATAICAGNSVVLNANLGAGFTYQWIKNGNAINGATGASYTDNPGANTPYQIVVTDANGCVDTSSATTVTVNALPVPTTTTSGNTSFCPGGSVTITANNPGSFTYAWYNNGNLINGQTSANYTANAAGSYTVTETSSTTGCSATSTARTVVVNSNPSATISTNGPTTFCPGGSVVLTATTTPAAGFTYEWLNGTTIVGNAATYTANASGTFKVRVVYTNTGCIDTSSAVTVNLFSSPNNIIAPAGPTTFCQGSSVVLNTSVVSGVNYQWQLNSVAINGADSSTYTANQSGSYTVVVSNSNCSSTTPAVTVTVNALPSASITASGPLAFCSNKSVTFTANSGAGLTYQWLNNGTSITGPGATAISYTTSTNGIYRVVVTDANGCSKVSTDSEHVQVYTASTSTISTPGSPVVCQGDTVHLYANVSNASNVSSYQWLSNGNTVAGAITPSYGAVASGVYTLVIKSTSGGNTCYDTSSSMNIVVNPKPVPVISAAVNVLSTVLPYTNYQWYFNSNSIAGAHAQSYTATASGNYSVFVIDNNNCSAMSAVYTLTDLAVTNISGNTAVNIYPNPAVNTIHVEAAVKVTIVLSTLDGKEIITAANANEIDLSNLAQGLYVIKVYDTNGTLLKVEKIVKNSL